MLTIIMDFPTFHFSQALKTNYLSSPTFQTFAENAIFLNFPGWLKKAPQFSQTNKVHKNLTRRNKCDS